MKCKQKGKVRLPVSVIALIAAAWLVAHTGCGSGNPHTVPVKGKLTYNGAPVSNGTIMFIPQGEGGYGATGQIQADGTFTLTSFKDGDGAAPGTYKVTVQVFPEEGDSGEAMGLPGMEFGAGKKPPIPLGYSDPATTKLQAVINDGETELNLTLED